MKNVAAHTETGASVPGYISINEQDDDTFSITVRTRGSNGASIVHLNRDELSALAIDIQKHVAPKVPTPPTPVKAAQV